MLWNAMCLVVASCHGPEALQLETMFLGRMQFSREDMFYREFHEQWREQYTLACLLEVWYLLRVGRLSEAQVASAGECKTLRKADAIGS